MHLTDRSKVGEHRFVALCVCVLFLIFILSTGGLSVFASTCETGTRETGTVLHGDIVLGNIRSVQNKFCS